VLPAPLRASVQAGPIEDGCWCLLVNSNAVAAKVRQLLPALQAHLNNQGLSVNSIRLKVQGR
jgi:ethanolamine ammonia-lyase small subunit